MKPNLFFQFLVFVLFLTLIACKSKESKHELVTIYRSPEILSEDLEVEIINPSGSPFESSKYLGLPLNHGYLTNEVGDSLDILILSKHHKGKTKFKTLAFFELVQDSIKRPMILALPSDDSYLVTDRMSFDELMIRHSSIKLIIDTYFSSYLGIGKSRVNNWKDEEFANHEINSFLNKGRQ